MQPSLPLVLERRGEPLGLPLVGFALAASLLSGLSITPFGFVIGVGLLSAAAIKIGARVAWPSALLLTLPPLVCGYYGFDQLGAPLPSSAFGIGASGLW